MKRQKVESSNLAEVGYDPDIMTMEIKFKNGKIYQYWPITVSGIEAFMKAKSKGEFFCKNIRDNKTINYKQVDEMQGSK